MALQADIEIGDISFPGAYIQVLGIQGDKYAGWSARVLIYGDIRKLRVWDTFSIEVPFDKTQNVYHQLYSSLKANNFPDAIDI